MILSRLNLRKLLDFLASPLEYEKQRSKVKTCESPKASRNLLSIPRCSHHKNGFALAKKASLPTTDCFLPTSKHKIPYCKTHFAVTLFSTWHCLSYSTRVREKQELADVLAHNHALGLLDLDTSLLSLKEAASEKYLPPPHQNSLKSLHC